MTFKTHKRLHKPSASNVLSAKDFRLLGAASSHAALLIQEMIHSLAATNANAERVFGQIASLQSGKRDISRQR